MNINCQIHDEVHKFLWYQSREINYNLPHDCESHYAIGNQMHTHSRSL